jgi:hypothetical protein
MYAQYSMNSITDTVVLNGTLLFLNYLTSVRTFPFVRLDHLLSTNLD